MTNYSLVVTKKYELLADRPSCGTSAVRNPKILFRKKKQLSFNTYTRPVSHREVHRRFDRKLISDSPNIHRITTTNINIDSILRVTTDEFIPIDVSHVTINEFFPIDVSHVTTDEFFRSIVSHVTTDEFFDRLESRVTTDEFSDRRESRDDRRVFPIDVSHA